LLPLGRQFDEWKLGYSLNKHGDDFYTFYEKAIKYSNTLLLIESCEHDIFGYFSSEPFATHHTYYGLKKTHVINCFNIILLGREWRGVSLQIG